MQNLKPTLRNPHSATHTPLSAPRTPIPALVVGGGMITEEVILPTLFQQQRHGSVGKISVVSRRAATINHLRKIFPRERFSGIPDPAKTDLESSHTESYKEAIK